MKRRLTVTLLALTALVAAAIGGAPQASAGPAAPPFSWPDPLRRVSDSVLLPGSVSPWVAAARRLAPLSPSRSLSLAVELKVINPGDLRRLLRDLYDPASPRYHHFLTPAQFAARFAPSAGERSRVTTWLRGHGFRVTGSARNGLLLTVTGCAGTVRKELNTALYTYRRGTHFFYANARPVTLPGNLAGDVSAIAGLSNATRERPVGGLIAHAQGSTFNGYAPKDLATFYDLGPLYQRGITGTGQTAAIVSYADYSDSVISKFDQTNGLTSSLERVTVKDGTHGATLGDGEDETEADIEILQGAAPGAHVLVYEADNSDAGSIALFNQLVSDDRASVISNSWGSWETSYAHGTMSAMHQALEEAAAQGQDLFSASGDAGAYDEAQGSQPGDPTKLAVDYPASDPWATGVGGTTLQVKNGAYAGEIVWSSGSGGPQQPKGSGGGLSVSFQRPYYQTGPGVDNSHSNGMRQVPDVAANADANTGYSLYVHESNGSGWGVFGGTSASAPLWAGWAVLANQLAGRPLGFLNPLLYAAGASPPYARGYHDVTAGTNLYYPATSGWDFATGWGSFDGQALASAIAQVPVPPTPTPTPSPTPTATPVPRPWLVIDRLTVTQTLGGKQVTGTTLHLRHPAVLTVYYRTGHAGQAAPGGRVILTRGGQSVATYTLHVRRLGGRNVLTVTISVRNRSLTGKVVARIQLTLLTVHASRNQSLTVRAS